MKTKLLPLFLIAAGIFAQNSKTRVLIIVGYGVALHCDQHGCLSHDAYWTGADKVYAKGFPSGWSDNWKDAKQYGPKDPDPNFDIPNGRHCCYSEYPTPIDPATGKEAW